MYQRILARMAFVFIPLWLSGCGTDSAIDLDSEADRKHLLSEVKMLLTDSRCGEAITQIEKIYFSKYVTNQVRLLRAAAHGCGMGINFFPLLADLSTSDLSSTGFWNTMTRLFPSKIKTDSKLQSGWYATDSLFATLLSGSVIAENDQIFFGSYNPGSIWPKDREPDANGYLIFVSMGVIGETQNRYGYAESESPASYNYKRTKDLVWKTYDLMQGDESGCGYAAGILNTLDAMKAISTIVSGQMGSVIGSTVSALDGLVETACATGCQTPALTGASCAFTAAQCSGCPQQMRHRSGCAKDLKSACAAAGLIHFINSASGWPCFGVCT